MRHARPDYERFQDPAAHPDCHIYEFIGKLARLAAEGDAAPILAEVAAFFGGGGAGVNMRRVEAVRQFAARADMGGWTPISKDEPVFLIRGRDVAAVAAVRWYAAYVGNLGAQDVASRAAAWADEIQRWQSEHGSKVPDLPPGGRAVSHRDVATGRARTWPYGTRKTVKVEEVVNVRGDAGRVLAKAVIAVEEETREGWVLSGVDLTGVEVGQVREIVFREGGLMGGYWDFFVQGSMP